MEKEEVRIKLCSNPSAIDNHRADKILDLRFRYQSLAHTALFGPLNASDIQRNLGDD
jgi:hypothetical protein